jgi:hypothetical protein
LERWVRSLIGRHIPDKNPGDDVRAWERKQGHASLRIEAGAVIDPRIGNLVPLGLPYGEKPRLVLIHLATQAVRTGSPVVDVEQSMTGFARTLGLDTKGQQLRQSQLSLLSRQCLDRTRYAKPQTPAGSPI